MTESNPVQVTLSDDGIRINAVTDQAKSTDQDVKNLYDPNMMSVIEKQGTTARFAGETSRYNVLLARAKDAGIDTKELESSYATLNTFMGTVIGTGDKASDIDRDKYAEALANFNNKMALIQDALQSSFDKDIANAKSDVAVASQVASNAEIVASQAVVKGNQASAAATTAIQAGKDASNAYDKLKISNRNLALMTGPGFVDTNNSTDIFLDQDVLTLSDPVWVSFDWSTEKAGAWRLNQVQYLSAGTPLWHDIFVDSNNGETDISVTNQLSGHYSGLIYWYPIQNNTTSVRLHVNQHVSVGKVTIKNFILSNSSKEVMYTPAETVLSNAVIGNAQIKDASINTAKISELSANKLSAGTIDANLINVKNLNASNITAGKIGASHLDVGSLSALSANMGTVTAGTIKGVDIVANTFSTANGTFTVDDKGNVTATSLSLIGNKNFVYNSELMANGAGWNITNGGYVTTTSAHNGTPGIGINSTAGAGVWNVFGESKKVPFTNSNSHKYSASAWFIDWGSQAGAAYQFTLAFNDSNGNRLPGFGGYRYYATGRFHDWQLFTINGVTPPAGSATVSVQYWLSNGQGHAAFSQPMLTQSDRYQGYTSDTGNILSAGQVILDNNGTLTTTYDGVDQDSNNHYHAWKLNTGTLKIGSGYIVANSNGSRTIDGATQNVGNVQSTLAASYIKFTSATGGRTYMDADLISLSTGSLNDLVVINSNGIHIADQGIEIKGGVNASTTWGQFNQIRIGQSAHTINSVDGSLIGFQSGYGNTGNFVRVKAAGYDMPSLASLKKEVIPYDDKGSVVANTDLATYKYKAEGNTDGQHMGPILDDVNDKKAYYTRQEITAFDGSGIDTTRSLFYGWSAVKALQRENEQMQIRLRKLEITEETNNG
ncbi:tail fiber [Lactiplantibacillus xiangfangensis]|uniref:Tail fiber n=1 Tax=Lactiplantibacillus xiangfangensis TaxID=942150 RepID=A0A0R2MKL4_9LACO|nr:hypothetical protein [Lactiplantibacillus xiangfangensis]KRO14246.1 tail fiber [Lactiplantibacillus xiangfangensis]